MNPASRSNSPALSQSGTPRGVEMGSTTAALELASPYLPAESLPGSVPKTTPIEMRKPNLAADIQALQCIPAKNSKLKTYHQLMASIRDPNGTEASKSSAFEELTRLMASIPVIDIGSEVPAWTKAKKGVQSDGNSSDTYSQFCECAFDECYSPDVDFYLDQSYYDLLPAELSKDEKSELFYKAMQNEYDIPCDNGMNEYFEEEERAGFDRIFQKMQLLRQNQLDRLKIKLAQMEQPVRLEFAHRFHVEAALDILDEINKLDNVTIADLRLAPGWLDDFDEQLAINFLNYITSFDGFKLALDLYAPGSQQAKGFGNVLSSLVTGIKSQPNDKRPVHFILGLQTIFWNTDWMEPKAGDAIDNFYRAKIRPWYRSDIAVDWLEPTV